MSVFRINPNQERKIKFFSVDIKHNDLETYEDIELALDIINDFISNKASDSELIRINERLVNAVYTLIGESKDNYFETNQLKEQIEDLEYENKQLKNELDFLDEEYDGLQSEYSLSEMSNFDISEKILNYEAVIRELRNIIDEKDEKLNEIETLKKHNEKLKSEINLVDEIAIELREVIAKRDEKINNIVDEITDLKTIIVDKDNTIKNMEKSILKFKETFIYVRDSILDLDNDLDNNY